jgi:hypothetical protein
MLFKEVSVRVIAKLDFSPHETQYYIVSFRPLSSIWHSLHCLALARFLPEVSVMSSYFTRKWSCWFTSSNCLIISLPSISADVIDDNLDVGDFSVTDMVGSVVLSSLNCVEGSMLKCSAWVISWSAEIHSKVQMLIFFSSFADTLMISWWFAKWYVSTILMPR